MINTYDQTKTIGELYELKNQMDFELAVQRPEDQWDIERKSNFIYAMIYGYPTGPIWSIDKNGCMYQIADGKQRLKSALFDFIEGKYVLDKETPMVEGEEIGGKIFVQLSENLQKRLLRKSLNIGFLKDPTDEEIEEFFRFINSGVSLTAIQITRVLAGSTIMKFIKEINTMPFFQEIIAMPEASRRKKSTDEELIMQIIALIINDGNAVGLSGAEMRKLAKDLRHKGIEEKYQKQIRETAEYLYKALPDKQKDLRKVHVPMVFLMALQCVQNDIPATKLGGFVQHFFAKKYYDASGYRDYAKSKTADKGNVVGRIFEMQRDFDQNIDIVPDYKKPEPGQRGRKPGTPNRPKDEKVEGEGQVAK